MRKSNYAFELPTDCGSKSGSALGSVGFKSTYLRCLHFLCNFLGESITNKWGKVAIPKSVFGEPIAIAVDLRNGIEIGFKLRYNFELFSIEETSKANL